ncbi:hypothetical protein KHQ81_09785 [Mycoplasmatota bacterium]|nr:hypothetical protein KHQ81_09785 [Mycoplasmatota bacterium]
MNKLDHEQTNTLDLQELVSLLIKNSVIIILVTLVFTLVVGFYTHYGITPKYESKTLINVSKKVNEEQSGNSSDIFRYGSELAKRYSIISKSNTVIQTVQLELKNNHNLELSEDTIKNCFEVVSVNDTDILRITVTYPNYLTAQDIANAVTNASIDVYEATYTDAIVTSIDTADLNENPVSPNLKLNIVIGFVLGLLVSVGFVLIKELMNRKIKTEKDIEEYLDIPYFGSIPNITKIKCE